MSRISATACPLDTSGLTDATISLLPVLCVVVYMVQKFVANVNLITYEHISLFDYRNLNITLR